ncbi:ABC transporter ATP-binding protein [Microlunatus speluncae]|uniref:ABC transporter ATP-binding protein n=1 Tax=Microlunatus speluncae TaxID=2594267 RepID=UPI00126650AB|nr:ABC transporter ATP-binding protein [Microlunatus speluncae]
MKAASGPRVGRPITIDAATTPRRLVLRTVLAGRRYVIPAAVLAVLHQLGEGLVPVVMGLAIDRALATGDLGQLVFWIVLLAVDFTVLSLSYRFGSRIGEYGLQVVQHQLRGKVTDRLLDPAGDASTAGRLPGEALSVATSDVNRLSFALMLAVYPVGQLAAVIFAGIVLLVLCWPLGIAVLVGAPLMLLLLDRAGGPLRRRSESEQELAAAASGRAADLVTGYRVLRGLRAERIAAERYRRVSREALDGTLHARRAFGGYVGTMSGVSTIFVAAIAVAAGLFALNGSLSVGGLITIVGLTQFILSPLRSIAGNAGPIWAAAQASAARVLAVLTAPPMPHGSRTAERPGATAPVSFAGVSSGPVRELDLRVEAGEFVGVRATGGQADVLVALLAARRPPERGELRYGGIALADYRPEAIRAELLVAPHAADLFEGTVLDNLELGEADSDRADRVLAQAGAADLMEVLPDGHRTAVGEAGARLSGGQRQRVALARALAQDAPVLVLHDPTTAVDSVTEAEIARQVRDARNGRTTIVITNSPAWMSACDRVIEVAS